MVDRWCHGPPCDFRTVIFDGEGDPVAGFALEFFPDDCRAADEFLRALDDVCDRHNAALAARDAEIARLRACADGRHLDIVQAAAQIEAENARLRDLLCDMLGARCIDHANACCSEWCAACQADIAATRRAAAALEKADADALHLSAEAFEALQRQFQKGDADG